jgi:hypothetical protein
MVSLSVVGKGEPTPSATQAESLKKFLQNYLRDPRGGDDKTTRFSSYDSDLKDDGTQEVIVYVSGQSWCGSGGCKMLVLEPKGSSYAVIAKTTLSRLPIRVLDSKSHGWHDIAVTVQGGGILEPYQARLSYDGRTYPRNPTLLPARKLVGEANGEVAIPSDAAGTPLY